MLGVAHKTNKNFLHDKLLLSLLWLSVLRVIKIPVCRSHIGYNMDQHQTLLLILFVHLSLNLGLMKNKAWIYLGWTFFGLLLVLGPHLLVLRAYSCFYPYWRGSGDNMMELRLAMFKMSTLPIVLLVQHEAGHFVGNKLNCVRHME